MKLLTAKQVGAVLGLSRAQSYDLMRRLGPVRIGRAIRLSERVLLDFIANGGDTSPTCTNAATSGGAGSTTTEASASGAVHTSATTRWLRKLQAG